MVLGQVQDSPGVNSAPYYSNIIRKSGKIGKGWDANTEVSLKIAKGFKTL